MRWAPSQALGAPGKCDTGDVEALQRLTQATGLKKILVRCQYTFLIVGIVSLGYSLFVVAKAARYQAWAYRQLEQQRTARAAESSPARLSTPASMPHPGRMQTASFADRSVVGRIQIPRIHLSAMIAEGTSGLVLEEAAGHVSGSALPGQSGNVVIAAHRDTFFRRLGQVRTGDKIELTTPDGEYFYRVRYTDIVGPDAAWVLRPTPDQTLTLVTCYPFNYVGAAPERFVVHAQRLPAPLH
jgi:sortase A